MLLTASVKLEWQCWLTYSPRLGIKSTAKGIAPAIPATINVWTSFRYRLVIIRTRTPEGQTMYPYDMHESILPPWTKNKQTKEPSPRLAARSSAISERQKSRINCRGWPCPALIARQHDIISPESVLFALNLGDGSFFFSVQGSNK